MGGCRGIRTLEKARLATCISWFLNAREDGTQMSMDVIIRFSVHSGGSSSIFVAW